MIKHLKKFIVLIIFSMVFFACQENAIDSMSDQESSVSNLSKIEFTRIDIDKNTLSKRNSTKKSDFAARVAILNEELAKHNIQLEKMEFLGAEQAGNIVFFGNVGNKQLIYDFVPNDPRNFFSENAGNVDPNRWVQGSSLVYWTDGIEQGTSSGMTATETLTAIQNTMDTWGSVSCSEGLLLYDAGTTTATDDLDDVGLVQWFEGFGGKPLFAGGSILHAGILPSAFFEVIGGPEPGGGEEILGVTFTFTWINNPDLNQNGKLDVAFKEIYINDGFNWQDEPNDVLFNGVYDFETVVLHEVGHGLNQEHFGKLFGTIANGKLHYAPYALMNAGYTITQREITATDNAGHCSNWGDWPNN